MKPQLIDKASKPDRSIDVQHHQLPHFFKLWHFHPELELVIQLKSTGTRFIGDNIGKFAPGDVVLVGANLPHMWLNDPEYFEKNSDGAAESYVVHFREDFAGEGFLSMPEMKTISTLLKKSRHGIRYSGVVAKRVKEKVAEMFVLDSFDQVLKFIQLLKYLSMQFNYELLSSRGFVDNFEQQEHSKLKVVYDYVMNHFKTEIRVAHIAEVVSMNPSSFSRYFSKVHGKSFSGYVNDVRIGYACRLLMEEDFQIARVCHESGFNNLSNFNRQFKNITGYAPSDYVKKYRMGSSELSKVSLL